MNLIGSDCRKIINDYKKVFECIEHNQKEIDNCILENFDTDIFNYFDDIFYENKIERRYYLNNYTIKEFKEYYLYKKYFMKITFKFLINNKNEDYFRIDIKKIYGKFLNNLKIIFIYKLNNFELCLNLGNLDDYELYELYKNIL